MARPRRRVVVIGAGAGRLEQGHRALDLGRVAPGLLAVGVQNRVEPGHLGRGTPAVPHVGVAGAHRQGQPLAQASDHQRQRPRRGRVEPAQPPLQPHDGRLQLADPVRPRRHGVAVLEVVALQPAGPQAEHQPAARGVVDGAGHVGQQVRVAVAVARHQGSDPGSLGDLAHGGQRRPALEARPVRVAVDGVEVVEGPQRVGAEPVGLGPGRPHGLPRGVVGAYLGPDRYWAGHDAPLGASALEERPVTSGLWALRRCRTGR